MVYVYIFIDTSDWKRQKKLLEWGRLRKRRKLEEERPLQLHTEIRVYNLSS